MTALSLLKFWREGLIAALAVACLFFWGAGQACKAARAEDKAAAQQAKADALEDARVRSDAIIAEQAQAIAARAAVANTITERIIHVPVTTACAASPAMRAATDGLRQLFLPGGGQAPAGGKPSPAVR